MDGIEGEILEEASWIHFLEFLATVQSDIVVVAILFPGKL